MKCLICNNDIPNESRYCLFCGNEVLLPATDTDAEVRPEVKRKADFEEWLMKSGFLNSEQLTTLLAALDTPENDVEKSVYASTDAESVQAFLDDAINIYRLKLDEINRSISILSVAVGTYCSFLAEASSRPSNDNDKPVAEISLQGEYSFTQESEETDIACTQDDIPMAEAQKSTYDSTPLDHTNLYWRAAQTLIKSGVYTMGDLLSLSDNRLNSIFTKSKNDLKRTIAFIDEYISSVDDKLSNVEDELIRSIVAHSIPFVDKRSQSRGLWIIGEEELSPFVAECREKNIEFFFNKNGGPITDECPGWWTVFGCEDDESLFYAWLLKGGKTAASVRIYMSVFNKCSKAAIDEGISSKKLIEISDAEELDTIINEILSCSAFYGFPKDSISKARIILPEYLQFRQYCSKLML